MLACLGSDMPQEGVLLHVNHTVICRIIHDCIRKTDILAGRALHCFIVYYGWDFENDYGSHLIRMYAVFGNLKEAHSTFAHVLQPNLCTWSTIIAAHAKLGLAADALKLYEIMQCHGVKPNKAVFMCILKACSSEGLLNTVETIELLKHQGISMSRNILNSLLQGCSKTGGAAECRKLVEFVKSNNLDLEALIGDKFIRTLASCGSLREANEVFEMILEPSTHTWNAIISAHVNLGKSERAVSLFYRMQEEGIQPNQFIFTCILKACGIMCALWLGRLLHHQIILQETNANVTTGNALLDMYSKCGDLDGAWNVFEGMEDKDAVSWGSMVVGFSMYGLDHAVVELYDIMEKERLVPNRVIFLHAIKACGNIGAVGKGRLIHAQVIRNGLHTDDLVGSTLVEMYSMAGSLEDSENIFHALPTRDIISWGALIGGYAQQGNYFLANLYLENMLNEGLQPDGVIFTSILAACCHAGLLNEGSHHFKAMIEKHGIGPNAAHYNCLIGLLGRLGFLDEVKSLLNTMPALPDIIGWKSLLTGCKKHLNAALGSHCFNAAVQSDPYDSAGYVLMSNIFVDLDIRQDVDMIHISRQSSDSRKLPSKAWIEINADVNEFVVGHTHSRIRTLVDPKRVRLSRFLKEQGHVSQLDLVI